MFLLKLKIEWIQVMCNITEKSCSAWTCHLHVDPSPPQMVSQVVAGSWGDQGAFCDLATWSLHAELSAFQCLCKNKAVFSRHSVHRHSELSSSQLTAQFLSRAVNPFSFPITDRTTCQLSQKTGFEMPGLWKKWLSHACPVSISSASIRSGNVSPMRSFTQTQSCVTSVRSVGKSKARLRRSSTFKAFYQLLEEIIEKSPLLFSLISVWWCHPRS